MTDKIENEIEKDNNPIPPINLTPQKEYSKKVGNYILNEQIGIGTFSKVTKAIHTLTGELVAVKILDKSKIKDNIDIERISREIEILKSISHPNISQLYESNSTIHNFYLIMEYIEGGDLCDYINKNICLNENIACHFFRQLISVIEYLNEMGITHRDIKPENILLDSNQQNIKVIDFGLSNYCTDSELLQSACGSPCFASPEMLSGNPYNGITTDIWSSGIVLYSMLVGTLPFDDQELNALYEQIKIGTFYIPSTLSLEAIDFLKKILRVEPEKRLNISEIKEHIWFNLENNIMYKGIDLTVETFPYDEDLIEYVISKFYYDDNDINKDNFIKMVQYHACNQYTATYYLTKNYLEKFQNKKNNINIEINENKRKCFSSKESLNSKNNENKNNNNPEEKKNNDNEKNINNNINNDNNNKNENGNINDEKDNKDNKDINRNSFIRQRKKNSNYMKESKEKNNNTNNTTNNNKNKCKNLISNNNNNKIKDNTKINIIKKEIISDKKSPNNNNYKSKKNNYGNNKNLNLFLDCFNIEKNKKLVSRINTIFQCIKNIHRSENNSKNKKTKSWQKKEQDNYLLKKNKKEKNKKIIYDKNKITRNHFNPYHYITEYPKKYDITSQSSNNINNIRFAVTYMKKDNISLTDRGNFSNSIFAEEPKVLSFNNSKINSIKTDKIIKNTTDISPKNRKNSKRNKNRKKNENNSMNISKNNFLINNKNEKNKKNNNNKKIDLYLMNNNKKFTKYTFNQNKKKPQFQININPDIKKLKMYNNINNNHILTDNNQDRKDSKANKIKCFDSTHSSLHMKKIYYDNKNIKTHNNTINKYKELINKFNSNNIKNNNIKKNKLKKVVSKLEIEYFNSINNKLDEKSKNKRNKNKNSLLIMPSQNHSLSKTKTLNNISNNNINTLSQNYSNNIEDNNNKIKPNLIKNTIKNKKKLVITNGKYKLFQPYKYKKDNLKININSYNLKLNKNKNIMGLFNSKIKQEKNIYKTHRKNSSCKKNGSSFIKTNKNSGNKNKNNPFSQNSSISPENKNNNIKNMDNNKKIINININNILKINKKYSINLTKSSDSSKQSAYANNITENSEQKNIIGIKNYNSSYPLVNDKNNKYKGAIKYYSNYYTCKNKNNIIYPKIKKEKNKNYSSMLKRQLFEEQLFLKK